MIVFEVPPWEEDSVIIPSYRSFGEVVCTYLSILYGKRFDSHGFFESRGSFHLPNLDSVSPTLHPTAPPHNHSPRKNLEIELNLAKFDLIRTLVNTEFSKEKFLRFLQTAGGYYYRALQVSDTQPEVAFLNLVTCGEILSNYYDYERSSLLNPEMQKILRRIESEIADGDKLVRQISNRLLYVKARYTRTILRLLNEHFFSVTESPHPHAALREEDIEKRIKAAYDLRSKYVHSGTAFGKWTSLGDGEIQGGKPVVEDKDYQKILVRSPTFMGLERIMRYCLLRFIQIEGGIYIDSHLSVSS